MGSQGRLIDDLVAELSARSLPALGQIEICGLFGDLCWPPQGGADYLWSRRAVDPAFTITGYTRVVALARILDEIRYFAEPIVEGAPSWWWSGEDPDRVAAVSAEVFECELGAFASVGDAVRFSHGYLTGAPLHAIDVPRRRRDSSRYSASRSFR